MQHRRCSASSASVVGALFLMTQCCPWRCGYLVNTAKHLKRSYAVTLHRRTLKRDKDYNCCLMLGVNELWFVVCCATMDAECVCCLWWQERPTVCHLSCHVTWDSVDTYLAIELSLHARRVVTSLTHPCTLVQMTLFVPLFCNFQLSPLNIIHPLLC